MIVLRGIHYSLTPIKHGLFYTRTVPNTKNTLFCLCKSKDSDESSEASPPEGDTRKQELLARIAMLQAQKVRLTDYLDERSAYLTQFAEEANIEFDKIGEDALKGLDEASSRIMENIESKMQAFEESAEMSKQEIEESENKVAAFEGQIEKDRNEGLFFKNLRQSKPVEKAKAKEEMKGIEDVTRDSAGSKTRRNIYRALIGILVIAIADSAISTSPDWRKIAVFGAILAGLITQVVYEQSVLSDEVKQTEEKKSEDDK